VFFLWRLKVKFKIFIGFFFGSGGLVVNNPP